MRQLKEIFDALRNLNLNEQDVNNRFRRWHVDALLNQGADLTDRCVDELRELRSLYLAKAQFEIEIEKEEKQFLLESQLLNIGFFDRKVDILTKRSSFLKLMIETRFSNVRVAADRVNSDQNGQHNTISSATVVAHEKNLELDERVFETKILDEEELTSARQQAAHDRASINAREAMLTKLKEFQSEGNIFSFQEKIEEVEQRLIRDYEDAFVRLTMAQKGLKEIYGHEASLPIKPKNPVSELSIWNREAIEFIISYQQLDQSFTRAISLRSILSDSQWKLLETQPILFRLDQRLFSQHENVRLSGLGASIIGKAGIVPWSIIVTLPGKAIYKRGGNDFRTGQDDLPSCLIGKVENRNSFRVMEYCGTVSLINASPIGQPDNQDGLWKIAIETPTKNNEIFADIDDIVLEIVVVGHPI
ncbi:hypothetical protein LZD49_04730 [Dyadobacter sp. CY261]|uniref:hypothetical protein n=1 Tax=Dyadobacter sp. CY261 TaxID=2907203 RepID=UPI001F36657E|nr:hypothetical protein [Dyadobacter sp. CY261]MCF0069765.1 hypothetical protein [Dyadobacter sp. CY261]